MRHYYVYILFRRDGSTPFYVGKGHGRRLLAHEKKSKYLRTATRKDSIIRGMRNDGREIPKIKVAQGLSEPQAFDVEKSLIAAYGRINNRTGILTNLTDGGDGASGWV